MIKKIYDYLATHGFVLMMVGLAFAVISLLVYFQTRYHGSATPRIAFGCTIAGFVIYVLGRIFIATNHRKNKYKTDDSPSTQNDES